MKRSIIVLIQKLLGLLAKGVVKNDADYYLFKLPQRLQTHELFSILSNYGWQPHYLGHVYKGQIYQCRRIVDAGKHEYHVRFYKDGTVTGHFGLTPEESFFKHLFGIGSRVMTREEADELRQAISK